ncbi:MAG: type I restriction endonuclease subunit R [Chloroflexi bacterium]|uniref:type I restriction endonuclease subunit R n=1 Tax=Candidatus Flexifilum breve TaxID=3140694 RepID=UPI003135FF6E|nr:type I restriction endonuclease subunit R [Chloroflexota bacterium]
MSGNPSYLEDRVSQLPAVRLLMALGWQYLPPQEAVSARNGKVGGVLLDTILTDWLSRRSFAHKGSRYSFSAANITAAVNALKDVPLNQGLTAASMAVYELLTLGKGVEQVIDGSRTSFNLDFIDWQHPANNVYHVTDEFTVERRGSYQTRRPDIVLFVNGIPLAVIECKRPDKEANRGEWGAYEGVSQMLRNQRLEDEIPHLFAYAQLLMAVDTNHALYATLATPKKFWAVWKEEGDIEPEVMRLINTRLTAAEKDRLYGWHSDAARLRREMDANDAQPRLPTGQDRAVYALLRPARLLDLAYGFVLYDNGRKKIARYQQYFAVKATVERVKDIGADGTRAGGVIWHTTGSGKSLTMVMLAKALALHPQVQNPRVVLVTDRIDLDDQIWKTFRACGKTVAQARSGKHLTDLIREPRHEIITTVIDKFETVANSDLRDANPNVFVLVDESHRSQYGRSQAKMRAVFQKGCYIGFTGTPLLKAEKSTATKFGGFIHKYTMRQAVDDGAVAPLLYEGRLVDMDVSRDQLDQWFERRTRKLNAEQIADLKRKMSRAEEVNRVKARLQLIAYDIAEHYKDNWRGTGFKAQLATSSKEVAILYRQMLQDEGIDCEVVISSPDTREGNDDVDDGELPLVQTFWKQMMGRYTDEERYLKGVKASFARDDGTEILIVVDKLLVGFDEPLNTVLYIDKHLQEHNLLQAIARVNRLYEGKEFGYIVDYRGVLGELNEAMQTYNALEGFDLEDVQGSSSRRGDRQ